MEAGILKFICANQGAVNRADLICNLYPESVVQVTDLLCSRDKFVPYSRHGDAVVVARTRLRLCRVKGCQGTCGALHLCKNYLLTGACHFTQRRRVCIFSHELESDHNRTILREHELESLSRAELSTLLLQSDAMLLPAICFDYNNGVGEFGKCQEANDCKRLHICEKYVISNCSCTKTHDFNALQPSKILQGKGVPDALFGSLRSVYANKEALKFADKFSGNRGRRGNHHNSTREDCAAASDAPREWYRGRGRGGGRGNRGNRGSHTPPVRATSASDIFAELGILDLSGGDGSNEGDSDVSSNSSWSGSRRPNNISAAARGRGGTRGNRGNRGNHQQLRGACSNNNAAAAFSKQDKTEICMYFIKGHCKHEDRCFKAHDKMPYRWQVKEAEWTPLPDNETIEKDYCDPKNSYSSSSPPVHFDTMTRGLNQVRRLSTINSLREPTFIHTTEWLWYWQDEFGKWNPYASDSGGHKPADINSAMLEQKFLDNDKDVVEFTAGSQSYSLSFQDMIQTNKRYGTKRVVCRRPRFVSAEDVKTKKVRRPHPTFGGVPDYWEKTQIPEAGFSRILLRRTSEEFKEIETRFHQTMAGFDVTIERIQNKALWDAFQLKKNQLEKRNAGRCVTEMKLFHGTDSKHMDDICLHNFDWRICGTHGTVYGKGSYFARDAQYSHSYTSNTDLKTMFIARVLVGDYTKGCSSYVIPPFKDDGNKIPYDSCVDDVRSPSIFVVFEKQQIYPEYLLQYKNMHPLVDLLSAPKPAPAPTLAPAPKPAPAPTPAPAPKPAPAPTLAPAPKPAPAPTPAPAPKPAPAPTLAPAPKPAPAPTLAPAPKPAPTPVPAPRVAVQPSRAPSYKTSPASSPYQSSYHRSAALSQSSTSSLYQPSRTSNQTTRYSTSSSQPRKSCVIA